MLRYAMPPDRVDAWLIASIQAAAKLEDADLWDMIRELEDDQSPAVQGAAMAALAARGGSGA